MLRRALLQASSYRIFSHSSSISVASLRKCSSSSSSDQISNSHFVEQSEDTLQSPPSATISVDRSALYHPSEHSHEPSGESELVKHLKNIIKFRGGPISVAEYMEEVLTNPKAGFYINRDVFGAEGDFITSPEVSQMFGEMVGVWAMCLWEQMGRPDRVNLVELGPGRGTLLADLLRGSSKFKKFTDSLQIHMVECSPALQKIQYENLRCTTEYNADENTQKRCISTLAGTPVSWHAMLEQVPTGLPTIIIGHEFYDALPVHQFQKASRGWCEKMIDVNENSSFRFFLSPQPTPATLYLMKRCKWSGLEEISKVDHIEVCPKAMDLTQEIANRIGTDGGGALIIDYGLNGIISDSLQYSFFNILKLKSISSQAKTIGTVVSMGGAFIVVFYKGPMLLNAYHHQKQLNQDGISSLLLLLVFDESNSSNSNSNWILGGSLLAASYIVVSVWYIFQAKFVTEYPAEFLVVIFLQPILLHYLYTGWYYLRTKFQCLETTTPI
ncbi:hypothetical protein ACJIZ3_007959 [Penstemon smallii]|uniref:Protein arginine methyltransferase NDUFAF7 n=1 Tax=Penstemon smallii TaxID=265156 RepID=A0ABD3TAD0_9LAMI